MMEQITTYLDSNNLIHKHQYGFRKNHSTEYAALYIVNYLNYELDRNRTPTNDNDNDNDNEIILLRNKKIKIML